MAAERPPTRTSREQLAVAIGARCRLEGEFRLRSGEVSNTYFDKYLFESDPRLLDEIARHFESIIPTDTEVLGGLELGGVPLSVALALRTGLPICFVRKEAKPYGTERLAEGAEIAGRNVLLVEDVVTTGGQVAISTAELRAREANVRAALCVIDRRPAIGSALADADVELLALFTADELEGPSGPGHETTS